MDAEERWDRLCRGAGFAPDPETGRDLVRRWSEPHRRYHGLSHLLHALAEIEGAAPLLRDPPAASLALWFHDAVYDTRARDNEERSAALFDRWAERAGLAPDRAGRIRRWILATRHAGGAAAGDDGDFVLDADLAILGEDPATFAAYERGVREEYGWAGEREFRGGRARVLRSFLDRPAIYRTARFRERFEADARRNLGESLARLESRGPCLTCRRPLPPEAPHAPFCCDRCRLLDLGRWAKEEYTVGRPLRPDEVPEAGDDPGEAPDPRG